MNLVVHVVTKYGIECHAITILHTTLLNLESTKTIHLQQHYVTEAKRREEQRREEKRSVYINLNREKERNRLTCKAMI
jgi:hypothetical protein